MRKLFVTLVASLFIFISATDCFARGGFSSGGSRGGFSSSRSYGGGSRSYSGGRSYSAPRSYSRTYNSTRIYHYSGGYVHPGMMYGGFGMGYGYSNGILTGMIIEGMMHPQGTTVYNGGGYGGQALLYPNGAVVDGSGHQVGTYINGQFQPMQNGPMVAQQVPADAQQQVQQVEDSPTSFWESLLIALLVGVIFVIILFIALAS